VGQGGLILLAFMLQNPVKLMDEQINRQDFIPGVLALWVSLNISLKCSPGMAFHEVAASLLGLVYIHTPTYLPGAYRTFHNLGCFVRHALDHRNHARSRTAFTFNEALDGFCEFENAFTTRVKAHADFFDELIIADSLRFQHVQSSYFRQTDLRSPVDIVSIIDRHSFPSLVSRSTA
jgi:hypothetical protein